MALKLYLASSPVLGGVYGHLFLILWDDATNTGRTIGGNQPGNLSVLTAHVDLANEDEVNNPDAFSLQEFNDANTPASPLIITEITGVGDLQSAWNDMSTYASGIDSVYDYDAAAAAVNATSPIANSNAFAYSVLNAIDVDARPYADIVGAPYGLDVPGANINNTTLLGSSTPGDGQPMQLIAASVNLSTGVNILGRDNVDDLMIGTQNADNFYGEQEVDPTITKDTVSYERSDAGVTITNIATFESGSYTYEGSATGGHAEGDLFFGIENFIGSDQNDVFDMRGDRVFLIGGQQDNILIGGKGNDTFAGGEGNDKIDGGKTGLITIPGVDTAAISREEDGIDTVDYSNAVNGITVEIGGGGVKLQNWGFIDVTNDGDSGQDELYSIEKTIGTAFTDTVTFSSLNHQGALELDGGSQPSGDPYILGDLAEFSALGSGVTLTALNGIDGTEITFINFERFKGTDHDDTVSLAGYLDDPNGTLAGFVWADLGDGNDTVEALGRGAAVFLGAGNDTVTQAGNGTIIHVGTGEDTITAANNIIVIGAGADDHITIGERDLTGGLHNILHESAWTHIGRDGVSYAKNTAGDLVIRDANKDLMFVANYDDGLGASDPTAGITIADFSIDTGHYIELDKPQGWVAKNFEFLDAAFKAFFGYARRPGGDPLVLDLDGDGLELTPQTDMSPVFDLDADGFAEPTGWVFGDDGLLARDLDGDGKIGELAELFGNASEDGFTALSALDSNLDGIIDAADTDFADLLIWQDFNQNGVTDAGELQTLSEAGIQSINLSATVLVDNVNAGNIGSQSKIDAVKALMDHANTNSHIPVAAVGMSVEFKEAGQAGAL